MLQQLHRNPADEMLDQLERAQDAGPPTTMPDTERIVAPRWPRNAKIVTAVLATLALAGAFGTALQLFGGDDTTDADAQIAELTEQRDQLDAQYTASAADLAVAEAENVTLATQLAAMTTQVEDLTDRVGDLQATNDTVTTERDALVALFPVIVDTSLGDIDVTGTYTVRWLPAYNSGLPDLVLPTVNRVVIGTTPEGWLDVTIPGVVRADLVRTDGALFTMVDTTTAVPPVDGVARLARVAVTIYAGDTVVEQDGTTTVTNLGMSVAISTAAVGGTPAGVALYGAELTPRP